MKAGKNTTIFFRLFYFSLVLITLSFILWGWLGSSCEETETVSIEQVETKPNQFGFYSDSLIIQTNSVLKNETLSDILLSNGIAVSKVAEIVESSKDVFDVRKIRTGNTYHSFFSEDTADNLIYFVYEKNPTDFVVFDLNDTVRVYEGNKEVSLKINTRSAKIEHSL